MLENVKWPLIETLRIKKTSGDQEDMFIEPGSGPHGQKFDDELPSASAPNKTPAIKKLPVKPGATATPAPKPAATRLKISVLVTNVALQQKNLRPIQPTAMLILAMKAVKSQ